LVRPMTEANLRSAFAGESQAYMRYFLYAERARDKYPNTSRLFEAIAYAECVHARNHYRNIRSKGEAVTVSMAGFGSESTLEDLQIGIDGENFEVEEMYPAYLEVAHAQKEYAAEISFRYALEAEKTHAVFYERAKKSIEAGNDIDLGPICVCSVCGHTVEGEAPEKCPICKAKKDKFKAFLD
jgi:rubrerythrin